MEKTMQIRQGAFSDIESIMSMMTNVIQILNEMGIDQWDSLYPDHKMIHRDIAEGHLWVGEKDKQLAGFIVLNQEQPQEYRAIAWEDSSPHFLVVHRLCVNPVYQGLGIAKILMAYAEEFAKEYGLHSIRLDAFPKNAISCKLYEKLGYKLKGTVSFRKGEFYCYEKKMEFNRVKGKN